MLDKLSKLIHDSACAQVENWTARLVHNKGQYVRVRQNILEPIQLYSDRGIYIQVNIKGHTGYAATDELTATGIRRAFAKARAWAEINTHNGIASNIHPSASQKTYRKKAKQAPEIEHQIDFLLSINKSINIHENIADWASSIHSWTGETLIISSELAHIHQEIDYIIPSMYALANQGPESQRRSAAGSGLTGGMEQMVKQGMTATAAEIMAQQALDLLAADNCPSATSDILLMPSQMMLQIHESIGHPLELDRILGDERNYAGTSFVDLDMFGQYQYGSPLLNVSFSPHVDDEMASYAYDDDGSLAEKVLIIENGILMHPLGGALSQLRAGKSGTANARASSWNRPPIDRMANLNLEAGDHSLVELISTIESGVLMDANLSWSIDDSRNKFQFGCEFGQIIKNGELKQIVKNPNYRGISANFWRNLKMVGNAQNVEIWGTPNCGKGEPNQMVHVGHASPPCVFNDIEIFGGD